jgi:hypothetical protein
VREGGGGGLGIKHSCDDTLTRTFGNSIWQWIRIHEYLRGGGGGGGTSGTHTVYILLWIITEVIERLRDMHITKYVLQCTYLYISRTT